MLENEPAKDNADLIVTIRLMPARAAELRRLAGDFGKEVAELAKEYLESEVEAEHGLRYGPWLRKYMYR